VFIAVVVAILALGAAVGYRIWRVPRWVFDGATTSDQAIVRINAYRSSLSSLLGVLIQFVGGIGLATGLFFTWRQIKAGQEAQLSERFSKAIGQLDSDRIHVRVGGIQGLERVSEGREAERESAVTILSAFVVDRCRERDMSESVLPQDIQIAVAALIRFQKQRTRSHPLIPLPRHPLIPLRGANLAKLKLGNIDLSGFDLENADFSGSDMEGASLFRANVTNTNFTKANLKYAEFIDARLFSTIFHGADLSDALFRGGGTMGTKIDFRESNLTGTDFEWSHIGGDFRGATLEDTMFYGVGLRYSDVSNLDLRRTRGLADLRVKGAMVNTTGTILPGKTPEQADAASESSGRPWAWRPDPRVRVSTRAPRIS
jgi:hypothetical protein